MDVQITVDGHKQISRKLMLAADDVGSLREPMKDIGGELRKTFDMNFEQRGGLYGGWQARKPQYKGGRRVDTWPLLEKSGTMRGNFKQRTGKDWVSVFNPTKYFRYHQRGTARIPQRVMMALREQDGRMVVGKLQRYCIDVLRKRGLR